MSILSKLSSSLHQRNELANQEVAILISQTDDQDAVLELISNLGNADKNLQSDCIKVLYELGRLKPDLIATHQDDFISLLNSRNNRLAWGAMAALDEICTLYPARIHTRLAEIIAAADKGSVISKDHAVSILVKLAGNQNYRVEASNLLLELLKSCPSNQLPMYAENALHIISGDLKPAFLQLFKSRLADLEKESKRKRLERVISKLMKD